MINFFDNLVWLIRIAVILSTLTIIPSLEAFEPISAGNDYILIKKNDSTVWGLGCNQFGNLGNGVVLPGGSSSTLVQAVGLGGLSGINISAVETGFKSSIALDDTGQVWTWGYNSSKQLGDNTTTDRSTPVIVSGLPTISDVSMGLNYTVVLKSDGSLLSWGDNTSGQLGDETNNNSGIPVSVRGLSSIISISCGASHTAALKEDGTVWTWGDNTSGQLGDGTITNSNIPIQVTNLSNIKKIAAGDGFTMALKEDGTVWTWGDNTSGQLGDGTTSGSNIPIQAMNLSNILKIAAGDAFAAALRDNGTIWTWGNNSYGQLGDNTTIDKSIPSPITGISSATSIAAGNGHLVFLKNDNTCWAVGNNNFGQLGDGTTTNSSIPVQVVGLSISSPPTVLTGITNPSPPNSTTFNGSINPNGLDTIYYFEYGTTSAYGYITSTQNTGVSTSFISVAINHSGLDPNKIYHYRLVANNSAGNQIGDDKKFIIFDFSKLDSFGNLLPNNALNWTMVRDNINGIIWEVKNDLDYSSIYTNPHDSDNTYTWYDSNPVTNGGDQGVSGTETDTEDFITAVNNENYGGFNNWRMPTIDEMRLIANVFIYDPAVYNQFFPNTSSGYYWTSTTYSIFAAYKVNILDGYDGTNGKGNSYHAIAVRSGPVVFTNSATEVTSSTATLNGSVNPHGLSTNYYFEYGINVNYGSVTPTISAGSNTTNEVVSTDLISLMPNTIYHFRVVAINSAGTTNGNDQIFTTTSTPITHTATTTSANGITSNSATLNGSINPNGDDTNWYFEYGLSISYGFTSPIPSQNAGSGITLIPVAANLIGLIPNTTYFFRLVATNSTGNIYGDDMTFTTLGTTGDNGGIVTPPDNGGIVTPPDNGGIVTPPDNGGIVTPPDNGGIVTPPITSPDDTKPPVIDDPTDIIDISDDIDNIENEEDVIKITDNIGNEIDFIQENIPDNSTPPSDAFVEAINTTTQNIGIILEESINLFKEGTISLEQALKPLELLDSIIGIGANVAKSGGAVSLDSVAGSIGKIEGIINEAISQNATSEQMNKSSNNINNILGNMPDIMTTVLITTDVIKILEPIKGLVAAGITSAVAGSNDPVKTVENIGDIVVKGLSEASDAGMILNTAKIINSAGEIVNYAVNVLGTETTNNIVIGNTFEQLQIELSEMIDQTASNIKDKPVSNSFAASSSGSFTTNDFNYVMDKVAALTTSMVKAKSVLNTTLTGSMQNLSRETLNNILPSFIPKNRFASITEESDIQKLFTNYPQLLNEVIKIASVNLTSGMLITRDDISEIIKNNTSLTSAEKTRLIKGLPELPAFDQDIIQSGSTALSLVELLSKELENPKYQLPNTTIEVISSKGLSLMVMLKNEAKGIEIPLYIQDARVVSSIIPSDLYRLPEGPFILVRNGIAGIITPAPLDAVDTLLSADALINIENLFGSDKKEISDLKINNSGNLNIKFKDGSKFSGSFGYGTSKNGEGDFDAGTSSFELQMTDPASEAYSVLVTYSNGTTQTLSPSIAAIEQLVKVLDTLAAGSYTLDKTTGIFTVLGARFKPSYLIEPIATSEQTWFKNNKDDNGIAWETKDYNGDGAVDLKMWTAGILGIAEGKQIIYTVVQ
ncbi:MAG: DUF1566 domain-containing protein [Desulfamplus sp.]|nr:DUF1566 domain-containing protein [Desulfamplus sp.]